MPPKPKFTREEIIETALQLVSEQGMSALTARDLGERLGSSARPIFTLFKNMEEVQQEVRKAAINRFNDFALRAEEYTPAFKQFGMQMILFSIEEPKLFQMLFMTETKEPMNFEQILDNLGIMSSRCIDVIMRDYGLSEKEAMALFKQSWIFTFGIGTLCAAGVYKFTEAEINELLGQTFMGMMMFIKSGGLERETVTPVKKEESEMEVGDMPI